MKKFDIMWVEEGPKKYFAEVSKNNVLNAVKSLNKAKARFITATACENPGQFYIFYHFEQNKYLYTLWTKLKGEKVNSIASVYPTANWIEREMADLYGIKFSGKPQKSLLLTPDIKHPFKENL